MFLPSLAASSAVERETRRSAISEKKIKENIIKKTYQKKAQPKQNKRNKKEKLNKTHPKNWNQKYNTKKQKQNNK